MSLNSHNSLALGTSRGALCYIAVELKRVPAVIVGAIVELARPLGQTRSALAVGLLAQNREDRGITELPVWQLFPIAREARGLPPICVA